MDIQPIETYYNGYKFRSRLEARWAVFFDEMGIDYLYENEGYKVEANGKTYRYLPDFYFPEFDKFGEVKGVESTSDLKEEDVEKMEVMVDFGPQKSIIFLGNIPFPRQDWPANAEIDLDFLCLYHHKGCCYKYAEFQDVFCNTDEDECDAIFEWPSLPEEYDLGPRVGYPFNFVLDKPALASALSARIKKALAKARQAQFEYGQTPIAKSQFEKDWEKRREYLKRQSLKFVAEQAKKDIALGGKSNYCDYSVLKNDLLPYFENEEDADFVKGKIFKYFRNKHWEYIIQLHENGADIDTICSKGFNYQQVIKCLQSIDDKKKVIENDKDLFNF